MTDLALYIASWPFEGHPKSLMLASPITSLSGWIGGFGACWFPETEYQLHFYIDLYMGPLDNFRCQSGPLTQFTLGRFFSGEGGVVAFRNAMRRKYSVKMPRQRVVLFKIKWKTQKWNFYVATLNSRFWSMYIISASGWIVDGYSPSLRSLSALTISSTFSDAHRTAAKELHTSAYCTESMLLLSIQ